MRSSSASRPDQRLKICGFGLVTAQLREPTQQFLFKWSVRWVPKVGVNSKWPSHHRFHMTKRIKTKFPVIAAHSTWADTANWQFRIEHKHQRVIVALITGVSLLSKVLELAR